MPWLSFFSCWSFTIRRLRIIKILMRFLKIITKDEMKNNTSIWSFMQMRTWSSTRCTRSSSSWICLICLTPWEFSELFTGSCSLSRGHLVSLHFLWCFWCLCSLASPFSQSFCSDHTSKSTRTWLQAWRSRSLPWWASKTPWALWGQVIQRRLFGPCSLLSSLPISSSLLRLSHLRMGLMTLLLKEDIRVILRKLAAGLGKNTSSGCAAGCQRLVWILSSRASKRS